MATIRGELKVLMPCYEPGGAHVEIYPHWEANIFTIAHISNGKIKYKIIKRNKGELIVNIIRREGVNIVIAKSLSTRALELLKNLNVKVCLCKGECKNIEEALIKLLHGELYEIELVKKPLKLNS